MTEFNANASFVSTHSDSANDSSFALSPFPELTELVPLNFTPTSIGTSDIVLQNSNENQLCSRCKKNDSVNQYLFSEERENVRSFIASQDEGNMILSSLEKHGQSSPIPEAMISATVRLLINRELSIILKRERVSLQNPLKHFE